jgi:hypothetical protein
MKSTSRIFLVTLPSSSRKTLRVWTGRSLHKLRHRSVRQLGHVVTELQKSLEARRTTGYVESAKKNFCPPPFGSMSSDLGEGRTRQKRLRTRIPQHAEVIRETARQQRKDDLFDERLKRARSKPAPHGPGLSCNEASVDNILSEGEST